LASARGVASFSRPCRIRLAVSLQPEDARLSFETLTGAFIIRVFLVTGVANEDKLPYLGADLITAGVLPIVDVIAAIEVGPDGANL
jgi:hypothetical protein